jgi:transcriptional regulator with XRE-family HTH domain
MNLNYTKSDFCVHVREHREGKGITLNQLSDRSKIDISNLSKLETGVANPTLNSLLKVADGMDGELRIVPKEKKPK